MTETTRLQENERRPRAGSPLQSIVWVAGILVAAAVWFVYTNSVRLVAPDQARPASALSMRDPAGQLVELTDYRGSVVVVNVWASWCQPCRREIPGFSRVYDELHGEGLEILGLNVEELPAEQLEALGRQFGIRYPVMRAAGFGGTFPDPPVIPHSWFIDRQGRLRGSHSGYMTESSLRSAVRKLLRE